ncbi:MAG: PAS domain S-box protein [Balneolales bacterium]
MINRRIVIIEDDLADAELIKLELNELQEKFTIQVIDTRAELLYILNNELPDLVISDYNVPGINALEALKIIHEYKPDLPVILCSGFIGEEEAVYAVKQGVADYVLKDRLKRLGPSVYRELENYNIKQRQKADQLRYRQLIQDLPGAIYTCDSEGRIMLYNDAAARLWGREPEIGKDLWGGFAKMYKSDGTPLPLDLCPMAITLKEGTSFSGLEMMFERPDGQIRHVLVHPSAEFDAGGRVSGAVNMLIDITDQKIIEKEKDEALKNLRERIKEQSCLHKITILNEQNLSIDNLLSQSAQLIPEGFQYPEKIAAEIELNGKIYQSSNYRVSENSLSIQRRCDKESQLKISVCYLAESNFKENVFLKEENFLMESIGRNLCLGIDKKKKEAEKEKLNRHNELLLDSTAEGLCGIDQNGNCTFINKAATNMLGYSRDDCLGKNMHQLVHNKKRNGDIYQQSECPIFKSKDNLNGCHVTSEVFWKADDTGFDVEYSSFPIIDQGVNTGAVVTFKDITERKLIEEKLSFQANLLDEVGDAVIASDLNGRIIYWNQAAEHLYGWSFKEVEGLNILDVIPNDQFRSEGAEVIASIMKGEHWTGEFEVQRKNGSIFPAKVTDTPIIDDQGKIIGIIGISTDITDRKLKEEAIQKSLDEKNILLAEIHHRVKNNLAIVSAMLQLQADDETIERVTNKLLDSVTRIKAIANIHEYLYKSKTFSELDFSESLEQLITDILNTYQDISVKLNVSGKAVYLNINQAIPCSLIVNEVTTNILKHAFIGVKKWGIITSIVQEGNKMRLLIKDNGNAFEGDLKTIRSESMGLEIIAVLAEQLKADYSYSRAGNYNQFTLEFEIEGYSGFERARYMFDQNSPENSVPSTNTI